MPKKKEPKEPNDPKVRFVIDKYTESRDYYSKMREKFTDWDDLFFSVPGTKKYDWMSNLFIPETYKSVMTLLARVINNTFAVDPSFDVVPSNKNVSNLIRSQMYRSDFFTQYVLFCIQLLVRGTSIGKVSWQVKSKTRFTLEKIVENVSKEVQGAVKTGDPQQIIEKVLTGYKKVPKEIVKYDGPVFEVVDLFDFYPEAKAVNITDGARVFRSVKSVDDFRKGKNYVNKEKVVGTSFPSPDEFPHSRLQSLGITEPSFEASATLKKERAKDLSGYVELLECETTWYNEKTDKMEPWLLTIANREIVVRDEAFPYWNVESLYVKGVWLPILGEFYGIGVPELAECMQEELNDKRNQRIDNINQVLQPVFMFEEGAIDPKIINMFERKPGARLRLRPGGINAKEWDVCPDVTAGAMVEAQVLTNGIEEVTGAVKSLQPGAGGADVHRTSSGLMLLQSMAHEKIKLNLNFVEKMVLEPVWEKYYELNLQFLTPGYKIFDTEGKPQVYTPELIAGDYEFRAKGSRYALDQQMKVMNISRVIEALGTSGLPPGELYVKFWMKLYEALGFEDREDVEKILRAEIQKAQQMQQMMMQAKAQGGGGGGASPIDISSVINQMTGQGMGMNQVRSGAGSMIPGG
jgi:hypothetical protein